MDALHVVSCQHPWKKRGVTKHTCGSQPGTRSSRARHGCAEVLSTRDPNLNFPTKENSPEISELKFQALSDPQKWGVTVAGIVLVHPQNGLPLPQTPYSIDRTRAAHSKSVGLVSELENLFFLFAFKDAHKSRRVRTRLRILLGMQTSPSEIAPSARKYLSKIPSGRKWSKTRGGSV